MAQHKNLFILTRELAQEVRKGGIWEGTSTASDTTTITDATIGLVAGAVDGGTIWLPGVSPANTVTRIITSLDDSGVVTFTPSVSGLTGAQDYTIFGSVYPRHELRSAINRALQNAGEYAEWDILSTVGLQEEYDLETLSDEAANVRTVELSAYSDPSTADNPAWGFHYGWIQTGWILRFLADPPVYDGTLNMRIGYNIRHPEMVWAGANTVVGGIDPMRILWEAIAELYAGSIGERDSAVLDEQTQNLYNRATVQADKFPAHRMQVLPPSPLFLGVGSRGGAAANPDLLA